MELSCAFATSVDTPDHVVAAEELGYRRAWLYDSPALYADVWMALGLAAARTRRIGLGPGVVVPHLRHPVTTAAAIATLERLAPGRVAVGVGSGFTGRFTMGQKPMRWADVERYVTVVRTLLAGGEADWEGGRVALLHHEGFVAPRPMAVPFVIGAEGPKGYAVAERLGAGVFAVRPPKHHVDWSVKLATGTVLDEGEDAGSPRAIAAAGHGAAVAYHGLVSRGAVEAPLPGFDTYRRRVAALDPDRAHLEIHHDHLVAPNRLDEGLLSGELLRRLTWTGSPAEIREHLARADAAGVTEVAFQPAGDIPRELAAFAAAAAG